MSRREWKIITAFVVVRALMAALILSPRRLFQRGGITLARTAQLTKSSK